jgi:hypothetical protein
MNLEMQTDNIKAIFKAYDVEFARPIGSDKFPLRATSLPDPEYGLKS